MKNLPIEKQVCAKEQAYELFEIFQKAKIKQPESYFKWVIVIDIGGGRDKWQPIVWEFRHLYSYYHDRIFPAYTGDELGVMLRNSTKNLLIPADQHLKADLAIQGLSGGWIKKEDFNY